MKKIVFVWLAIMSLIVITGCNSPYRPIWYRENATYAEVKKDSEWCKSRTKTVDLTRIEIIVQYERCMKDKGYQLKERKP